MSDKEIAKLAFEQAEKEAREEKVKLVKEIVKKTLEKLDDVKKQIKELKNQEKVLKLDIEDLKNGKLDLIAERQEKDEKAKEISVVTIIKEKEVIREVSPWYWPYQVVWTIPSTPYDSNTIYNTASTCLLGESYSGSGTSGFAATITCSTAKDSAIGAYNINGSTINLR